VPPGNEINHKSVAQALNRLSQGRARGGPLGFWASFLMNDEKKKANKKCINVLKRERKNVQYRNSI